MDYTRFIKIFGSRIEKIEHRAWYKTMQESHEFYNEVGEDQFITELEDAEGFADFCDEYYDFMRERWNACSGSMWDAYNEFKIKFERNQDNYWNELNKCARKSRR